MQENKTKCCTQECNQGRDCPQRTAAAPQPLAAPTAPPIATSVDRNVNVMRAALQRIARWHGEFPETGETWQSGRAVSYGAAHGSNGERDYMRQVALNALAAPASPAAPTMLEPAVGTVDWLGLALDLEQQAKRTERQTVERAMMAGANGLRIMGDAIKSAAPVAQPLAPSSIWQAAVLEQCMRIETGYVEADPRQTLENIISWHCELAVENMVPVNDVVAARDALNASLRGEVAQPLASSGAVLPWQERNINEDFLAYWKRRGYNQAEGAMMAEIADLRAALAAQPLAGQVAAPAVAQPSAQTTMPEGQSLLSLEAAQGDGDDLGAMADLIAAVMKAATNGEALGIVARYRQNVREKCLTAPSQEPSAQVLDAVAQPERSDAPAGVAEAIKALKPFAKVAKQFADNLPSDHLLNDYRGTLMVKHLRQAATALAALAAPSQQPAKGGVVG